MTASRRCCRTQPALQPCRDVGQRGRRAGGVHLADAARRGGAPRPKRRDTSRRRCRASGSIPRARPARPKAPCISTRTSSSPPSSTPSRSSASPRATSSISAAKLFFAYGLGNSLTFPLAVGATDDADGRAADARRRCSRVLAQQQPDDLLRRADALRGDAGEPGPAAARRAWRCASAVSAGEALPEDIGKRWTRAVRRRHPRRHRLDRDAAYLPLEPPRRRCATARAASRCRATPSSSSTTTASRRAVGEIGEL